MQRAMVTIRVLGPIPGAALAQILVLAELSFRDIERLDRDRVVLMFE